jgi:SAM-dependent methyltransferase
VGKNNFAENLQSQHFDSIASNYAAHHGDTWSQKYRHRFINEPMLENINLSGSKVIDALCGSGESTGYLLCKGAEVTGVDISQKEMENFRKHFPSCIGKCKSILSTGLKSNYYDCVVMVGGLHHLHPNVLDGIKEIHRILKVGGFFCFVEPHTGSLPDRMRQLWYKYDSLFAENEAAIDLAVLKNEFSSKFKFIKEDYKGNIAFLLVFQSLVFRIPLRVKPIYSPLLLEIESMVEKIQGKLFSCIVVCQWMKV